MTDSREAGTPRTDAECQRGEHFLVERLDVSADFARALERELSAATSRADGLERELAAVREKADALCGMLFDTHGHGSAEFYAMQAALASTESASKSFEERVRAEERERCANVCENGSFLHDAAPDARFGKECAQAIRALGPESAGEQKPG